MAMQRACATSAAHGLIRRHRCLTAPFASGHWPSGTRSVSALIARMETQPPDRVALASGDREVSYTELLRASQAVASLLKQRLGHDDLRERRVVCLFPPGEAYVAAALGVWRAGGIFVPLHYKNPRAELEYVVDDAEPAAILAAGGGDMADLLRPIAEKRKVLLIELSASASELAAEVEEYTIATPLADSRSALIIYTSGTTGKPKGVVSTHRGLRHQIADLVHAWEWSADDRIPHFLPLHHVHGVVNKLLCPLWEGATVEFQRGGGNARALWERLAASHRQRQEGVGTPLSLFMAVPTVYANLIESLALIDAENPDLGRECRSGARELRLMISGSAPLPVSLLQKWEQETGHRLLERYGMTEIGMCLTNPYRPVERRFEGYVGRPLPSVRVRVVDSDTGETVPAVSGRQGELRVKGDIVFKEYWRREEATAKEFDLEGWFKTGDIVIYDEEKESYRICGRASVDIIKSAGYKISAIDIERVLAEHPAVAECYIMGVPDEKYGERVAAIIRGSGEGDAVELSASALREWCSHRMAPYKIPRVVKLVDSIPKNAMGKVNKKQLRGLFD